MSQNVLNQIRDAVLAGRYAMSEHAYDEMDEDNLDVLDVEAAILGGRIDQALTRDRAERVMWLSGPPATN